MSDSPFFQFYPSDWLAGTRGLTAAETGVYITLVAMMYEAEGPIPNDAKRLARLCGSTPAALKKAIDGLIDAGKITQDERGFFNRRVEIEIEKRAEKRAAASASANARWKKTEQKQPSENANASIPQCGRNANQKPEPEKKKEEPNGSSKKRGSRLPPEWRLPKDWGRWAMSEGLSEDDTRTEGEKFRDYWSSLPGRQAVKLDWQATWRNWVRKAVADKARFTLRSVNGGKQQYQPGDLRIVRDRVDEWDGYNWTRCNDREPGQVEHHPRLVARIGVC